MTIPHNLIANIVEDIEKEVLISISDRNKIVNIIRAHLSSKDKEPLPEKVKKIILDYPTAFEICKHTNMENHHENCSYRTQKGGLICDCAVLEGAEYIINLVNPPIVVEESKQSTPQIELPAYVLNNLDYLGLLLDKMIEKSKSHLDKLKSLDK